jgi:hypothetical protein
VNCAALNIALIEPSFDDGLLAQLAAWKAKIFLTLLKRFTGQNRIVCDKPSVNYAPTLFAREEEAKHVKLSRKDFEAAMRQLFKAEKIWNAPYGKASRQRYRIAIK